MRHNKYALRPARDGRAHTSHFPAARVDLPNGDFSITNVDRSSAINASRDGLQFGAEKAVFACIFRSGSADSWGYILSVTGAR